MALYTTGRGTSRKWPTVAASSPMCSRSTARTDWGATKALGRGDARSDVRRRGWTRVVGPDTPGTPARSFQHGSRRKGRHRVKPCSMGLPGRDRAKPCSMGLSRRAHPTQ